MQPFRIEPKNPVAAMKTYSILAPKATHHRPATCAETSCPNHLNGWATIIDERTELGSQQGHYIRANSGRQFTETPQLEQDSDTGLWRPTGGTRFTFQAGQTCFSPHTTRLDKPELYVVRGGDHRGNPRGDVLKHQNPDDWVDDFGTHQQELADELEKG